MPLNSARWRRTADGTRLPSSAHSLTASRMEEVKDFLAPLDIPRDFESLVEIASRIDNRLRERERERRRPGRKSSGFQGAPHSFREFRRSSHLSTPVPESPSPPAGAEEPMQLGRTKLAPGRATEEAQGGRLLLLREIRTPGQPLPSKRGGSSGLRRVLVSQIKNNPPRSLTPVTLSIKVSFLGYVITANHISMDPAKVNAVTNWPPLTSKKKPVPVHPIVQARISERVKPDVLSRLYEPEPTAEEPETILSPDRVIGLVSWPIEKEVQRAGHGKTTPEDCPHATGCLYLRKRCDLRLSTGLIPLCSHVILGLGDRSVFYPAAFLVAGYEKKKMWLITSHGVLRLCQGKEFCRLLGATVSLSSGYHPESNGQTERMNQELETGLRCLVAQNQTTWSQHLTWIEYAHNTLPTAATGLSPFHVVHGYQPPVFSACEQEVTVPSAHALNGNLQAKPSIYRMRVHLFGAASSPGCANFGLKHLAAHITTRTSLLCDVQGQDDMAPRNEWKLDRITEVYPGSDDRIQSIGVLRGKRTMWKAAVFVFLLLSKDMLVDGAADKTRGSVAENSRLEKKEKTLETEADSTIPANDTAFSGFLGNLLVVPMDGSRWVGVKALAQEMGRRGHRVTVVMPEVSIWMGPGEHYDTLSYPVPYDKAYIDSVMSTHKDIMQKSSQSFMERMKKRFVQIQKIIGLIHTTAESLLFNDSLISHLAQQKFDAVLTDPLVPTGSLIARKFGIPSVNLLRGIPCSLDMKSAGCPSPPSYVPRFFTGYTDKMSFKERAFNTLVAVLEPLMCRLLYWHFDHMAYQFLGEEVGIAEILLDSAIWLLRMDFTLEFPRPLMPNVVLVGGINCHDLESWVSGEHGFIVFTLGSMVSEMPEETTSVFLEAFRQIPQKVIWRYTGQIPGNIPENVKLMHWVPQNDLLAHSGVRAFITHAGSHGLYEGLCHGVPMLMVPLSGDQPDNARKLESRGVGVVLDILSITTKSLLQGINEVINDARYKENVQKLSALHRDRPIDPLKLSVYWTEFVMQAQRGQTSQTCYDILIFSPDPAVHQRRVHQVLLRLLENQLYAKVEKCKFHASSVSFLNYVISDNHIKMDPEKVHSYLWKEFRHLLGATVSLSSGYHPESNGQTDRELKTCLRCLVAQNQTTWSDHLMWIEYAHNALPTAASGLSPFYVVYGYQPPLFQKREEVTIPFAHAMARRWRKIQSIGVLRGKRTMWKAAVFVFLLLSKDMLVDGAADKTRGSVAENSRPEKKEKTLGTEADSTIPASDTASSGFLGNLLVVPMDGSHWVGVKALAQEMGRRGHRVTVVMPEVSVRMGPGEHYDTLAYPVPYDKAYIDSVMSTHKDIMQKSSQSFMERIKKQFAQIQKITGLFHTTAESLLFNDSLISHLAQQGGVPGMSHREEASGKTQDTCWRDYVSWLAWERLGVPPEELEEVSGKFDAVLTDPLVPTGSLIARKFVHTERKKILTLCLNRLDFTLEFPRPLMPNVILVGGINCHVRNPLPEDLESWVSGEHGFIVFTLGSVVSEMPEETTSVFLEAFRQIPQKVIWRYTGQVPGNVPENVKLMHWVPQNDLLAHSGVRAFITHAGSHGLYEGLCHGVPMLMVPLSGDQPDNARKLESRGAGVVLDILSITTKSLLQGLNEVINDTRYKENVQKLSALHRDRPIDPLKLSVYWTEFVMRHKGAKHLRPAVHDLNWIQYYCLDVMVLLASVVLVF
ncbi:hypothetical protein L3Q82_021764, partial [Scortum barcoo]